MFHPFLQLQCIFSFKKQLLKLWDVRPSWQMVKEWLMDMSPLFPRSKRKEKLYFSHVCLVREYQRPSAGGDGEKPPKGTSSGLWK